jgi:hypothetical protein
VAQLVTCLLNNDTPGDKPGDKAGDMFGSMLGDVPGGIPGGDKPADMTGGILGELLVTHLMKCLVTHSAQLYTWRYDKYTVVNDVSVIISGDAGDMSGSMPKFFLVIRYAWW